MPKIHDGFFVYKEYILNPLKYMSTTQFEKYAAALLLYGICETRIEIDPFSAALLEQVIADIESCNRKYQRAKYNGKKGGRKHVVSTEMIVHAVTECHITTQADLADHFGCSVRTIQRRISKKEIDRILHLQACRKYGTQ